MKNLRIIILVLITSSVIAQVDSDKVDLESEIKSLTTIINSFDEFEEKISSNYIAYQNVLNHANLYITYSIAITDSENTEYYKVRHEQLLPYRIL